MKKNYVLDTNVLIHDPYSIFKFEDNDLLIPIYVIEEIDNFKRDSAERGRNARTVVRLLDRVVERGSRVLSPERMDRLHGGMVTSRRIHDLHTYQGRTVFDTMRDMIEERITNHRRS